MTRKKGGEKTKERSDWKKSLQPWGAEQIERMADYEAKAQQENEMHRTRPGKKTPSALHMQQ